MLYHLWFKDGTGLLIDADDEVTARCHAVIIALKHWGDKCPSRSNDAREYKRGTTISRVEILRRPYDATTDHPAT